MNSELNESPFKIFAYGGIGIVLLATLFGLERLSLAAPRKPKATKPTCEQRVKMLEEENSRLKAELRIARQPGEEERQYNIEKYKLWDENYRRVDQMMKEIRSRPPEDLDDVIIPAG